jgi:polysaccharide chain length determinant protein (PEP-CTERM system associated)
VLPGKKYTPEDVAGILVRRCWLILVPFAIGVAAVPLLARAVPERYRSETLILVEPQRVPNEYVKATVTESVSDRLPAIGEQLLSRSRLERIIAELDLYKEERQRSVMEDVVSRMRDADIQLNLASNGRGDSRDSFRISYVSGDPQTAQKVTERLASLTIEQNTLDRSSRAESTNTFLEAQLENAKQRLLEHERKLEAYRRRHAGQLPSQLQANLQAIGNAQLQLQSVSESMNRARERRLLIERQIADARALPPTPRTDATGAAAAGPLSTAQQLEAARARLEALRLRYTPDHPDVRSLERTIGDLQANLAEESTRPAPRPVERDLSPAELAHQRNLLDLKAELDVMDLQLAAHAAEEIRLKQVIADYQAKVDIVPTRESELVELTRDYETLDAGYRNLLAKWEDSKIAANLEGARIGEQFRIVDPASLPERPYNQTRRLAVMSSGAVAGLLLGLLLVAFLEYRDATFNREEDVLRALTLPVLALVPAVASDEERRASRRRVVAVNLAGAAVLVGSAAVVVFWRFVR